MRKPGYLGNSNLKPEGQEIQFTKEQIEEYLKCANDPSYFISKYIKVVSLDTGLVPFEMYSYQKKMIETIHNNRFVIAKLPRQSGKTTTVASYLLHYILFNQSVNIAILANKQATAREILARLKLSYEYLPLWLQQGVREWNKHSIVLENGSRIIAAATSSSAIRGGSYNCISGDSIITVKNTNTGEILDISIEDYYKLANSSKNTNNHKYLHENDKQQIQEMVFFSDRESATSHINRRYPTRTTSYYSDILGREQRKNEYCFFNNSGTYVGSSTTSQILNRNREIENVSCIFSNGAGEAGNVCETVKLLSKDINGRIFSSEENDENRNETHRRNKKENKISTFRKNSFRRNQTKNIQSKHRKTDWIEETKGVWGKSVSTIYRLEENKRTFGQNKQKSRKNQKNSRKTSRNEEKRTSEKKYEYSTKEKMCSKWSLEQRIKENKWQVYTSEGFKNFHGISKTLNQPTIKICTNNGSIVCTPDHKISTTKGFVCANLLDDTSLIITDSGICRVIEVQQNTNCDVYDLLHVEDVHAFYANGIEVHNCILLDEYAHVPSSVAEEFFSSVYPTITAGQTTRVIMISTPKGLNMFYKFWKGAQSKQNEYIPIEVSWNEVPKYPGGPLRDEEWKRETIRNSSERQFQEEFICDFVGSTNTLISSQKLNSLVWKKPISKTNDGLTIMETVPENMEGKRNIYFMVVDVARGQGKDYSAFTIINITNFPYKIVAKYKNNTVSPLLFPSIIRAIAGRYNNAYVMVELNDIGSQVADILHTDLEYENLVKSNIMGRKGQILNEGFGNRKSLQMGIKTSQIVKKVGCAVLKNLIENDKLIIEDSDIIEELTTFISDNSSFRAEDGYTDDLVMTLVLFSWATRQEFFKNITDSDIRMEIYSEEMKKIEEELLPFGYVLDGDPISLDDSDSNTEKKDNWMIIGQPENNQRWIDLYKQNKFF